MAEANRPRLRPDATRRHAKSSSVADSTGSLLSGESSSASLKTFSIFKRKKMQASLMSTVSMLSSQPESYMSQQRSLVESQHEEEEEEQEEQEEQERPHLAPTPLPELPPKEPLPEEETDDYDYALESAVHKLQNDLTSGAHQLAGSSLNHLAYVTDIAACMATSWGEFWALIVHAAKHLSYARPSMSATITTCLLRALERIARTWNEEQARGSQSTCELAHIAGGTFDSVLLERRELSRQIGECFMHWLHKHSTEVLAHCLTFDQVVRTDTPKRISARSSVRILTLGNSSFVRRAILYALDALRNVSFHIIVLEGRPRFEGADMAAQIYAAAGSDRDRLSIQIIPDCAVGIASYDIDIVLLGAERISSTGDVSNKIGSLAAAICAKQLNKNAAVVALSNIDIIAAPGQDADVVERHPSSELTSAWAPATRNQLEGKANVDVFGQWLEWVPAGLVDVYVTELGVLGAEDVEKVAREIGELHQYIFQQKNI